MGRYINTSGILSGMYFGSLAFYLTHIYIYIYYGILSDIFSGRNPGILSGTCSGILCDLLLGMCSGPCPAASRARDELLALAVSSGSIGASSHELEKE